MDFYRHLTRGTSSGAPITFTLVYLISVIFTFQHLLVAYSSSTYLELFLRPEYVGLLFSIGAAGALATTLLLPRLLRAIGNVPTLLILMSLIMTSLLTVGLAPTPEITIIAFFIYLIASPQIYFNIDIFLETLIGNDEGQTGSKRGLILTIMSAASLIAPIAMGYLIGSENNLASVYFTGAAVGLVFIAVTIAKFRFFLDPPYKSVRIRDMLRNAASNTDIRTVLSTQFLLQFFYTWAIIYVPLYLATEVGYDWVVLSQIIATGLLAFVIFEYPIGLLADHHWGEKEMMAIGFVVLGLASASISLMVAVSASVFGWMILMFISRFGASLVEVTTESYFFKKIKGDDVNLISLFRLMRPLANLTGALVGSICLIYLPFNLIFVVLGFIMVTGSFITMFLTDTR